VLELKAISGELGASEDQQLRNYLRILKIQRGLLINFQQPGKKPGKTRLDIREATIADEGNLRILEHLEAQFLQPNLRDFTNFCAIHQNCLLFWCRCTRVSGEVAMPRKAVIVLVFILSSLAVAKKQPTEQAVISWYEGPVRDWYGGGCPYHADGRRHFPIGIHGCWRNLVTLRAGEKYLTMEDHCVFPWKFQQSETVEFQRDAKYPRKIYVNRHVFALRRESDTPDELEHGMPAVRDNPGQYNSQVNARSGGRWNQAAR
jgi:hypothetical protein